MDGKLQPWQRMYLRSAAVRRASRWARQVPRLYRRWLTSRTEVGGVPSVLANSMPKSGTHLLTQIIGALPLRDYGTFFTSVPSVPHREVDPQTMSRALLGIVPGEVAAAHLFFKDRHDEILRARSVVHFFIYRDLRDVVISEADYLTRVNKWHSLHRIFRGLASEEERISLAITGLDAPRAGVTYPDVGQRFAQYQGWLENDGVHAVRYEDLIGSGREAAIAALVRFFTERAGLAGNESEFVDRALNSIDPSRSFTFRHGRAGRWREVLTDFHKDRLKEVAGRHLVELGYESDLSW